jgi:hypothetical protein
LRVRGSSTGEFSKASYDLELWQPDSEDDRAEPLGGMPSDGDWVLYAPYYFDDALIRNSLGYELSRAIGRYAPRTRFVELYMANSGQSVGTADYLGVYVLTEEIERGAERVDVVELLPTDIAEPEVTGGYVFKRDREGEGESGIWAGDGGGYFSFDEPLIAVDPEEDELVSEQVQYLARFIAGFADALVAPDFIDPHSGQHYTEIIDVDSFIDHHILNVLVKNPDAFRLSGYLYKDCEQLVFAGPLWDLDRTAGANDPRAIEPTHWDASNLTSDTTYFFTYGWYGRLFDDPDFRDRYWARWTELLQGELDIDRILDTIDLLSEDLDEAAARNTARWGSAPLQQELNGLKGWFEARHQWISSCIDQYPDPRNCPG